MANTTPNARDEAVAVDTGARRRGHNRLRNGLPRRHEIAVSAGAILGVGARFLISTLSQQHVPATWPSGTFAINLLGCVGIGIMQTLFLDLAAVRRELQLFVSVGLLGGFTTFSTFSVETVQLVQAGRYAAALGYQVASLMGGLLATILGITIAHAAHRRISRWRSHRV